MTTDWLKEMQQKAQDIKSREGGGEFSFKKLMNLTGKNAVVKPGGSFVVRLLPRWDYKDAAFAVKEGKRVKRSDYSPGRPHFEAFEHWWDGDAGKKCREWCPVTFDKKSKPHDVCPICKRADELRGSADQTDRKAGNSLYRKEVFLYNAVLRDPETKKRALVDGKPDVRILPAQNTIYVGIANIMGGDGQDEFARGDITKTTDGYDVLLTRPVAGGGERWKTQCASKPSPFLTKEETKEWGFWPELLHDLEKFVQEDMKSKAELHKLYFGTDAPGDSGPSKKSVAEGSGPPQPESEEEGWGMDGEGEEEPPF